jgi:Uma2 family endonuclease
MKAAEPLPTLPPGARIWPLSVTAYRALGEAGLIPKQTELLNGIVYKKMSESPLHSFLVMRLLRLIQTVLPDGCLLRCEQPITCEDYSEPEPDVSVVRGLEKDFLDDHPHTAELVIEVCVTSHDYDRSKLPAYAGAGVKECWLVLGPEKQIEVHRDPVDGKFSQRQTYGPGGKLTSVAVPAFSVDLNALFSK